MQCPVCGHDNPQGAKFCSQCGTRLEAACPVCSARVEPDSRFCSNCGTALTTDLGAGSSDADLARYIPDELLSKMRSARVGHAMRGERRQVTMLFADIQGSTAAAEHLDPEEWAEIINGAFTHLIAPVYRYEGTLARLQGDAVLAFFGAPIAHEDDPVRAIRAGLEMIDGLEPYKSEVKDRWGVPIEVRVGINTGLVVVGEVGSDLRVEYTALGDAINVAARMEQTADPGTVRITSETLELVGDAFEFEPLGPIEVRGKSEPVLSFRVLSFVAGERHVPTTHRLVGRSAELESLEEVVGRIAGGVGCITSIIGDAGVGKTRLVDELRHRTMGAMHPAFAFGEEGQLAWMFGASRSYDAGIPYATVRDLLRRWWGLDAVPDGYARIEQAVRDTGLADRPDAAAFLAHVTGTGMPEPASELISALDPPVLQSRVAESVVAYLEAEAKPRPVLVVLEDLHWADSMSLALVDDLMAAAERAPVGLVLAMRPYRDEPTWRIHETAERDHPHRYRPIRLEPLDARATEDLLEELLEQSDVSDVTRARILERSDGNPLFVEEMVRSLLDVHTDKGSDAQVPTTLAGLLTARLDRLSEESKLVAQMASVIRAELDRAALADLVAGQLAIDEPLTDLLRREILVERRTPAGPVLTFRHALMRDAAYGTILLRTRRELHRRVADHMIDAAPDSVQGIARHLLEAGEAARAFPYLIEAGYRASRSMALSDAIGFFTTALENIPVDVDPELMVRVHDGLGAAHALVPDLSRSAAAYQSLFEYGERSGRPSAQVTALNRLGLNTAALGADVIKARAYLEDARRLAEETGDDFGLAEYHMNSCYVATLAGELQQAVDHDTETVRIGARQGVDDVRLTGLVRRAENLMLLADFEKGIPALHDAAEVAGEMGAREAVAILEANGEALLRLRDGDVTGSLEVTVAALETLDRYSSFYTPMVQHQAGALLFELGDLEAALGRLAVSRRLATRAGQVFVAGAGAATMAAVYAFARFPGPIAELRSDALDALERPFGDFMASTILADLGFTDLMLDDPARAEESFGRGLSVSSITRFWQRPRLLAGQAMAGSTSDPARSHQLLDEAGEYVRERGMRCYDALLGYARGEVLAAEGRLDAAATTLQEAHSAAMSVGSRPMIALIAGSRASVAAGAGNQEEASGHVTAARSTIESMAGSIVDDELRSQLEQGWADRLAEFAVEA